MPRRSRGGLAVWLRETRTPLYLLDARRIVLFFNPACEALTGWTAADVVGRTCDFASEPDGSEIEALTCALCPPPEAFHAQTSTRTVLIPRPDGGREHRNATFIPLPSEEGSPQHVLVALFPANSSAEGPSHHQMDADLHLRLAELRAELQEDYAVENVIAASPVARRMLDQVLLAGQTNVAVHLHGPQGSGREFLARVIHRQTPRRLRPFVPLDCRRLTPFELKRTLQKAFEPDARGEPTPVELQPGALLLRNVSRLPRDVQQYLVSVLVRPSPLNHSLPQLFSCDEDELLPAVASQHLLSELYYRLTAVTIEVPPLRDRPEDLPLLAQFFLERVNRLGDPQRSGWASEAIDRLLQYNWPGQVAELKAVVEDACRTAQGPLLRSDDLPFRFRTGLDAQRIMPERSPRPRHLAGYLLDIERQEILRALHECRQNRAQAARMLGLTRARLYRRMQQLGIIEGDVQDQSPGADPDRIGESPGSDPSSADSDD